MSAKKWPELETKLNAAAQGLAGVEPKRMFGCHALFRDGQVFALIWKEGRMGFRLPEATAYAELLKEKGASPWKAGAMTMSHWVLVPPAMHDETWLLRSWALRAHGLATGMGAKKALVKPKAMAKVASKVKPRTRVQDKPIFAARRSKKT